MGLFDRLRKVFGHKNDEEKEAQEEATEVTSETSEVTSEVASANVNSTAQTDESNSSATSIVTSEAVVTSSATTPTSVASAAPSIAISAETSAESNATSETSAVTTAAPMSIITSEINSEVQLDSSADVASVATNELVVDEQQADKTAQTLETHLHDEAVAELDDQKQFVADVTSQTQVDVEHESAVISTAETSETTSETTVTSAASEAVSVTSDQEQTSQADEATTDDTTAKYDEGLKKSRHTFSEKLNAFLANFRSVDEDFFDDLEEVMIEADVGFETTMKLTDALREEVKLKNAKKRHDVEEVIVEKLVDMYGEEGNDEDNALHFATDDEPTVFLFVGVNGAGKTTTIGKLAHRYQQAGKKVLMVAGDTFRAGAIEQLQEWGHKVDVPVVAAAAGSDPAAVVFDAVKKAKDEHYDLLLVDTAGRLQNKVNLMKELEKIKRVITRELPNAPQETLLVLDATTGQNALVQAKQFKDTTNVTGIVLTKLDGTAKGGIVLAIRNELHIPVKLVGLGEQMDDLQDFDPNRFIYGLFKGLIVNDNHE